MTRAAARPAGLQRGEGVAAGRAGHTGDRGGRGAPGSGTLAPAILAEHQQAAAAPSSVVQADEIEHLRELTKQARTAFEAARDAFKRLEAAHRRGLPGTRENATFVAKVALFRHAADAVHQARDAATRGTDGLGGGGRSS